MKDSARKTGLEHLSSHRLRRACATHLLEGGADFEAVQQLMGHARPDTTQLYTPITDEEMLRVYVETHPRARRITPDSAIP